MFFVVVCVVVFVFDPIMRTNKNNKTTKINTNNKKTKQNENKTK